MTTYNSSHQGQGFIPWAAPHAFPLTNPHHSLQSYTIFLACLTSKPLFLKYSFMVLIHLFPGLPTVQLPVHFPTLLAVLSLYPFHIGEPPKNTFINPFI